MHHTNVHEWLKRYPDVEIKTDNDKKEIAGFLCSKAIADFVGDSLPDTDLFTPRKFKSMTIIGGINTRDWMGCFWGMMLIFMVKECVSKQWR